MADNINSIESYRYVLLDYSRWSQSRLMNKKVPVFLISLIVLVILYVIWFYPTKSLFPNVLDTKIYFSSLRQSVLENMNPNLTMHDKAQGPPTCFLFIRSADGALGNRMFLFASAYGLARLHQCQLYVAPWILIDLRSVFRIEIEKTKVQLTKDDRLVVNRTDYFSRYSSCVFYPDLLRVPFNKTFQRYELNGFYQAYGYFDKYREEINFLFQFNQGAIVRNVPMVEQLMKAVWNISLDLRNYTKDTVPHRYLKSILANPGPSFTPVTWIGIHIRRGDFLTFFKIDTSVEYLVWSMNYYRRKYVNCRFLIASDDKKYVQTHLGQYTDVFITPSGFFSGEDMAALALCEHTIVTAGTYGWWAAYLAGGDVVHDLNYPVPFQNCPREHYFPPWFVFPHNTSSLMWKPASPT
ncbi:unnamed protein product [Adineta ricciae]|uniref:L-Fucosyltransferase n=1 Tax=Adineta ricciae TaxID=249248 RepID=A0A815ALP0_ADIRI|nr:unnamed protein product [Adineta ricciae]